MVRVVGLANSVTVSGLLPQKESLATGDMHMSLNLHFNASDHRTVWDRGLCEVVERMHMYLQCGCANEGGSGHPKPAVDTQSRLFQLKHFEPTIQQTLTADNQEDGMRVQPDLKLFQFSASQTGKIRFGSLIWQ